MPEGKRMRIVWSQALARHVLGPIRVAKLWSALVAISFVVACESAAPAPTATSAASPSLASSVSDSPKATNAGPIETPCSRPTPSLVPALVFQNGNLDLNVPYQLGFVQFFLVPCRDIELVRAKYGLGPAVRVIALPPSPNSDPDDIRSRYYRASIPKGEEATFVTRLAAHPEDFQYVEFAMIPHGCAVNEGSGLCVTGSTIEPKEGPAGTSFRMRICCFDPGTAVNKTFTLPSGRTIVVADKAPQNGPLTAGWGGSAGDDRGLYTVTVTSDQVGSIVRFRID